MCDFLETLLLRIIVPLALTLRSVHSGAAVPIRPGPGVWLHSTLLSTWLVSEQGSHSSLHSSFRVCHIGLIVGEHTSEQEVWVITWLL